MTVSSEVDSVRYIGAGNLDTYPYNFRIFDDADLEVITNDDGELATLELDVDYTVTGAGDAEGGEIVLDAGNLGNGIIIAIGRNPALTQPTALRQYGPSFESIEDALDRQVMISQRLRDELNRTIKVSSTIDWSGIDLTLPEPEASTGLGWNAAANAIINYSFGSVSLAVPATDSVSTSTIQSDAVTEDKIADGAVTEDKIANDAVTADKIAALAVGTAELAALGVTTAKLAALSVTLAKLADSLAIIDYNDPVVVSSGTTATIGKLHVCQATGGDYTIVLPTVVGNNHKVIEFRIRADSTDIVTLQGASLQEMDGENERRMWAGETVRMIVNTGEWVRISGVTKSMKGGMWTGTGHNVVKSVETKVLLDLVTVDGGMENDTTNHKIVARRAGYHTIRWSVDWETGQTATRLYALPTVNNAGSYGRSEQEAGNAAAHPAMSGCFDQWLDVDDEVELFVYHNSAADRDVEAATALSVEEHPDWGI